MVLKFESFFFEHMKSSFIRAIEGKQDIKQRYQRKKEFGVYVDLLIAAGIADI